jgi:hypothetical protein
LASSSETKQRSKASSDIAFADLLCNQDNQEKLLPQLSDGGKTSLFRACCRFLACVNLSVEHLAADGVFELLKNLLKYPDLVLTWSDIITEFSDQRNFDHIFLVAAALSVRQNTPAFTSVSTWLSTSSEGAKGAMQAPKWPAKMIQSSLPAYTFPSRSAASPWWVQINSTMTLNDYRHMLNSIPLIAFRHLREIASLQPHDEDSVLIVRHLKKIDELTSRSVTRLQSFKRCSPQTWAQGALRTILLAFDTPRQARRFAWDKRLTSICPSDKTSLENEIGELTADRHVLQQATVIWIARGLLQASSEDNIIESLFMAVYCPMDKSLPLFDPTSFHKLCGTKPFRDAVTSPAFLDHFSRRAESKTIVHKACMAHVRLSPVTEALLLMPKQEGGPCFWLKRQLQRLMFKAGDNDAVVRAIQMALRVPRAVKLAIYESSWFWSQKYLQSLGVNLTEVALSLCAFFTGKIADRGLRMDTRYTPPWLLACVEKLTAVIPPYAAWVSKALRIEGDIPEDVSDFILQNYVAEEVVDEDAARQVPECYRLDEFEAGIEGAGVGNPGDDWFDDDAKSEYVHKITSTEQERDDD